ncbi:MAG: threonine aldolase [Acidimicrobiaceae bacterium]|nr:threonine aldolase [Acidimicrobiaceae bacterium]
MALPVVDLRSDTVTQPTAEMRQAMADAVVGDDVYREDPTVNALEDAFAERVGKQAALFVPSGTMGNQLALRVLTRPGDLVVAGARQHLVIYENAASARNAEVQLHTVDDADGTIDPEAVSWALDAGAHHQPHVGLVCVENTHMPANGAVWPLDLLEELAARCRTSAIPIHMDGARLWHAEVATGVSMATLAGGATTVMCCLSKGLCAPVGSLLAGPDDVIGAARIERSRLGGGMRQAGVIAAAGIVAMGSMVDRLAEDHSRARRLAETAAERWPDGGLDPAEVRTNIVVFRHCDAPGLLAHLDAHGIKAGTIAPGMVRMVTHHDIDDDGIARTCRALATAP